MTFRIVSYQSIYDEQIRELEAEALQGSTIKIKMFKPTVDARGRVFETHQTLVVLDEQENVAGFLSGAKTEVLINDHSFQAFYMFDARVGLKYRGNTLSHLLIQSLLHQHNIFGTEDYFVTLKTNNRRVLSHIKQHYDFVSRIGFVYLTIPTSVRIRRIKAGKCPDFQITRYPGNLTFDSEYEMQLQSLSIWNTSKMYTLEIVAIPTFIQALISLNNALRTVKKLPIKNVPIKMATLFNCDSIELQDVHEAFSVLSGNGISFLNVCCQPKDYLFNTFMSYAISAYPYIMAGTLPMNEFDKVTIDVRCL